MADLRAAQYGIIIQAQKIKNKKIPYAVKKNLDN